MSYSPGSLRDLLALDSLTDDLFESRSVYFDPYPLYGGHVASQALLAAGKTILDGKNPHSIHCYFLRPGDAAAPIRYQVAKVRDGRSFSLRSVTAVQGDVEIFTMLASFHVSEDGPDIQVPTMPPVPLPSESSPYRFPRLFSFEGMEVKQQHIHDELLTRFWARASEHLSNDPLTHACAVTYLSDDSCGVAPLDSDSHRTWASLDHSLWFHRPVAADEWMLVDLVPQRVANGRAFYTGSIFSTDGTLVASLAQETLYRPGTDPYFAEYR